MIHTHLAQIQNLVIQAIIIDDFVVDFSMCSVKSTTLIQRTWNPLRKRINPCTFRSQALSTQLPNDSASKVHQVYQAFCASYKVSKNNCSEEVITAASTRLHSITRWKAHAEIDHSKLSVLFIRFLTSCTGSFKSLAQMLCTFHSLSKKNLKVYLKRRTHISHGTNHWRLRAKKVFQRMFGGEIYLSAGLHIKEQRCACAGTPVSSSLWTVH